MACACSFTETISNPDAFLSPYASSPTQAPAASPLAPPPSFHDTFTTLPEPPCGPASPAPPSPASHEPRLCLSATKAVLYPAPAPRALHPAGFLVNLPLLFFFSFLLLPCLPHVRLPHLFPPALASSISTTTPGERGSVWHLNSYGHAAHPSLLPLPALAQLQDHRRPHRRGAPPRALGISLGAFS